MPQEMRKKHLNFLFMDLSDLQDMTAWTRVTKSVDFAIVYNAESETFDFISDETPTEVVKNYAPTIGQTQSAYIGEPVYDFIMDRSMRLSTGAKAKVHVLIVRQEKAATTGQIASLYECNLSWDTDDIVAGTITYSMKLSNPIHGSADMVAGVPTFTAEVQT